MNSTKVLRIRNVGFIATRIAGTDGVSLEIGKWARIIEDSGFDCFYVCATSDRPAERTFLIPEADFFHPEIREIYEEAFGRTTRPRDLSRRVDDLKQRIKSGLYAAVEEFQLDALIAENVLTIPMNIPFGLALTEFLFETGIPCIAHHHDFYWERSRFAVNAIRDYLSAAFPPRDDDIEHVVINSQASTEFSRRTGLSCRVIPNVMDFEHPPGPLDDYAKDFREAIGVGPDDFLILQPTRIVQRKGITHAIELVRRLDDPRCKLVVSHDGRDEGDAYLKRILSYAELMDVELILAGDRISAARGTAEDGSKRYSIWDVYQHADLVTYPSTYEGFGNAFLEAIYFRKPLLCNRYSIFESDILPYGFKVTLMDGFLDEEAVDSVRRILVDREFCQSCVDHNYELGRQFFSYDRVRDELRTILERRRPAGTPNNHG
ncbi:MAG: glycosyltransferase family 4 protein [Akkermansiaceae bacterium]|nr:glycosyltransferase family 4 protein [Akkermansiaceae bacterium]